MICQLCGVGLLPGTVCRNCGFDPSKPDARPTVQFKPSEPPPLPSDSLRTIKELRQAVAAKKSAKPKPKEKPAAPPPEELSPDIDALLSQIAPQAQADTLPEPTPAPPAPVMPPPVAMRQPPASADRPIADPAPSTPSQAQPQQVAVPVTTQFSFEGQHIVRYAGLVTAVVVVRVGTADDLLPAGQDIHRLSGGAIGTRLRKAIDLAIADLKTEAIERGGSGVVGARLEVLPAQGQLAIVTLIGTAVVLEA